MAPKKMAPKKMTPKTPVVVRSTVCLEGYKISKSGRCVKDKKYQTIIASIPMAPPLPGAKPVVPKMTFAQQIKKAQMDKQKLKPMKLREGSSVTFGLTGPKLE